MDSLHNLEINYAYYQSKITKPAYILDNIQSNPVFLNKHHQYVILTITNFKRNIIN